MPAVAPSAIAIFEAIQSKNVEDLQIALDHGATAGTVIDGDKTALMDVCSNGWYEGFKLLRHTATPEVINRADQYQSTALMYAAARSTTSVVRWLVRAGANINAQDLGGDTPLMTASLSASNKNLVALCRLNADVSKKDKGGKTALMMVIQSNQNNSVRALIKFGANVNQRDWQDKSPLMCAAQSAAPTIMDVLLKCGANLDHIDQEGNSILIRAAIGKNQDTLRFLLNLGVDYAYQNKRGKNAEDLTSDDTCRAILRAVREQDVFRASEKEEGTTEILPKKPRRII